MLTESLESAREMLTESLEAERLGAAEHEQTAQCRQLSVLRRTLLLATHKGSVRYNTETEEISIDCSRDVSCGMLRRRVM